MRAFQGRFKRQFAVNNPLSLCDIRANEPQDNA